MNSIIYRTFLIIYIILIIFEFYRLIVLFYLIKYFIKKNNKLNINSWEIFLKIIYYIIDYNNKALFF